MNLWIINTVLKSLAEEISKESQKRKIQKTVAVGGKRGAENKE